MKAVCDRKAGNMTTNEAKAFVNAIRTIRKALEGEDFENAVKICGGRAYDSARELCAEILAVARSVKNREGAAGGGAGGSGGVKAPAEITLAGDNFLEALRTGFIDAGIDESVTTPQSIEAVVTAPANTMTGYPSDRDGAAWAALSFIAKAYVTGGTAWSVQLYSVDFSVIHKDKSLFWQADFDSAFTNMVWKTHRDAADGFMLIVSDGLSVSGGGVSGTKYIGTDVPAGKMMYGIRAHSNNPGQAVLTVSFADAAAMNAMPKMFYFVTRQGSRGKVIFDPAYFSGEITEIVPSVSERVVQATWSPSENKFALSRSTNDYASLINRPALDGYTLGATATKDAAYIKSNQVFTVQPTAAQTDYTTALIDERLYGRIEVTLYNLTAGTDYVINVYLDQFISRTSLELRLGRYIEPHSVTVNILERFLDTMRPIGTVMAKPGTAHGEFDPYLLFPWKGSSQQYNAPSYKIIDLSGLVV
ncbi:MAG: hypothetical protein LBH57_04365 [Treponema sp.]|nr:hypothetical protein [Treponema sp.]